MDYAYINATLGGLLIGLSAILLMAFYGRIAGISGILFGGVSQIKKPLQALPNLLFIAGLMLGASIYYLSSGQSFPEPIAGMPSAIIAGLFVGAGTKLGSGCTSGHGVCGISRFSIRSLSATITFIFLGMLTVGVVKHVL